MHPTASARPPAQRVLLIGLLVLAAAVLPSAARSASAGATTTTAATATMSGRVTNSAGAGVPSVQVVAYPDSGLATSGSATTAADGTYTVTGLGAALYTVRFGPPQGSGYLPRYFGTGLGACGGTLVPLAAGEQRNGVDAVLSTGAAISGRVTDASGAPVQGVAVSASGAAPTNNMGSGATTNPNGVYTVNGLAPGAYTVHFSPPAGSWLVGEYFDNALDWKQATSVTLTGTEQRIGVDAVLTAGGGVSGTVTGPGKTPAPGVAVTVSPYPGSTGPYASGSATTASDGTYAVPGLPAGTYEVQFRTPAGSPLVGQNYAGRLQWNVADPVTVGAVEHRTGIDAVLAAGARLSGTVRDPSGTPLPGITVTATDASAGGISNYGSAVTAADGTWAIGGLVTGAYTVTFTPPYGSPFVGEQYNDKALGAVADPVALTTGASRTGIDAVLATGATLSGTVTGPGGTPLAGAMVGASSQGPPYSYGSATTAANGTYTIVGLAAASFVVSFAGPPGSGLASESWNDKPAGTVPDPIVLTAGERRTGVDAALATGASVSGTIRTAAGSAVVGGFVSLQSTSTGVTAQGRSGTDGTYLVSGLAAGSYTVKFTPPCALEGYAPQWYDGQASPSTATTLTLVAGQPRTGVDGVLPAEATISGTVRGAGGTGLGGASVSASGPSSGSAITAPDGTYTLRGLLAGSYTVTFRAPVGTDYQMQYWDNQMTYGSANQVVVAAGDRRSGIDAALIHAASVSGTVTGRGLPLAGVTVTATGPVSAVAYTGTDGRYTITGLTPGPYRVSFSSPGDDYAGEYYNNAPDWNAAQVITVASGEARGGIDAALSPLASIAGRITNVTGSAVPNVLVAAIDPSGSRYQAFTGTDGSYRIPGLAGGTYTVQFQPQLPYLNEWFGGATDAAGAAAVILTTGEARTGIDGVLDRPGGISGTVTVPSGTSESGVAVTIRGPVGDTHATTTSSAGTYAVGGLRAGQYTVDFDPQTLIGMLPVTGVGVSVADGAWTTQDAVLPLSGAIAGKVTSATLPSVGDVTVEALDATTARVVATTKVDATGTYVLNSLPVGVYVVHFVPAPGNPHKPKYYKRSKTFAGADRVTVTASQTTRRINVRLRT